MACKPESKQAAQWELVTSNMVIICNGKEQEVAEGTTLLQLLEQLHLAPDTVVVECDKKIVSPAEYEGRLLLAGQNLELIRFVGGG